jgi:hypothetical protein
MKKRKKKVAVGLQRTATQKMLGGITAKGWKPGQSGKPSGRRAGSVSPTAALKRALTRQDADLIARKIIALAKTGDAAALRTLFERVDYPLSGPLAIATAFAASNNEASSGCIAQVIIVDNGRDPVDAGAGAGLVQRVAESYRLPAGDTAPSPEATETEEGSEPEEEFALPASILSASEFLKS